MSSSSRPDPPPGTPHLDVAEIEQAEQILEQHLARGEAALGVKTPAKGRSGLTTAAWAAPGTLWLLFFLAAPVVFIILVSFWTRTVSGFEQIWTLDNYSDLFGSSTYWANLRTSFQNSLIVTGASLLFGFPVAYFLAVTVKSMRNQIALFIIALAPFWTSALIRAVAWLPMMGRQGALNSILEKIGVIDEPLDILLFSNFAVVLAMIQLYILFMVAPLFFMLAQIDKASLESARDLGANWLKTFKEVIIPQSMPGIVIGSIFTFVLSMGDYATVNVIGKGQVSSVGILVSNQLNLVQFPFAATSAVILVLAMMIGVFVLLRFSNLREAL